MKDWVEIQKKTSTLQFEMLLTELMRRYMGISINTLIFSTWMFSTLDVYHLFNTL